MMLFLFLAPYFYHLPSSYGLGHGEYAIDLSLEKAGNVSLGIYVGFFDIVTVGASYGGEHILGDDTIRFLPYPSFYVSANIIPEGDIIPAISGGYENRAYNWDNGVPEIKGRNFFASAAKTIYIQMIQTTLSGGISIKKSPGIFFYGDVVYSDVGGIFCEFLTESDVARLDAGFLISFDESSLYFAFENITAGVFRRGLKISIVKFF